jgi:hypothetical protein
MTDYEYYKTNDMAMVAYLSLNGHAPQNTAMEGNLCWWTFIAVGDLMTRVDAFLRDEAKVNPREYSKFFAQTKTMLWRELDSRPDR